MLTISQQLTDLVKRSESVLLVIKKYPTADDIASALALKKILEKEKKTVEIISDGFQPPVKLKFLPGISEIKDSLSRVRKFIIKLNTSKTKVEEFSYDTTNGEMKIFVLPANGMFRKEDVTTSEGDYRFDMIMVVGASDFESLGSAYAENSELFYETPVVNIDHKPTNERFGQINMVDLTLSSSAEAVYTFMKHFGIETPDADLATLLLCGMIAETKSFQKMISPQSLQVASSLIGFGARRDEIIKHLYFTKSLPLLRLWGKVLARLKKDDRLNMVWSHLSFEDFEGRAMVDGVEDVMEELIAASPEAQVIVLFAETGSRNVDIFVRTAKSIDASLLAKPFISSPDRETVRWSTAKSLVEVQRDVLESFRQTIARLPR